MAVSYETWVNTAADIKFALEFGCLAKAANRIPLDQRERRDRTYERVRNETRARYLAKEQANANQETVC